MASKSTKERNLNKSCTVCLNKHPCPFHRDPPPPQAVMYHPEGHLMTKIIYYYIQSNKLSTETKNLIITGILRGRECSCSWRLSRYQTSGSVRVVRSCFLDVTTLFPPLFLLFSVYQWVIKSRTWLHDRERHH